MKTAEEVAATLKGSRRAFALREAQHAAPGWLLFFTLDEFEKCLRVIIEQGDGDEVFMVQARWFSKEELDSGVLFDDWERGF